MTLDQHISALRQAARTTGKCPAEYHVTAAEFCNILDQLSALDTRWVDSNPIVELRLLGVLVVGDL